MLSPVGVDVKFAIGAVGTGEVAFLCRFKDDLLKFSNVFLYPGSRKDASQVGPAGWGKKMVLMEKPVFGVLFFDLLMGEGINPGNVNFSFQLDLLQERRQVGSLLLQVEEMVDERMNEEKLFPERSV